ncbi:MAG: FtsW/RodA/SpoVE family cell cycle protein [Armatimonadota bacterium]
MSAATHNGEVDARCRSRVVSLWPAPMDRAYFLGTWAMMIAGIVFVFSASFPVAGRPDPLGMPGNAYRYLWQHTQYVALGFALLLAFSVIPPRALRRAAMPAFVVALALLFLTLVEPWGMELNGARRWLDPPLLPAFQPAELMKVAFIMLVAALLARRDEMREGGGIAYVTVLLAVVPLAAILLKQPDLGMAMMFMAITLAMLFFAGASVAKLSCLGLLVAAGGGAMAWVEPYRWRRVIAFIDPENATSDDRYHIVNMLIAQARGGVTGLGLGMSPDKWRSLPAAHTDSIFSVIGCELGLVGALVMLAAIGLLTMRALHIARHARSPFGFYLASGIGAMLCLQSLAHIAVNTSCMPCTGLTLPFISGGGTSLISASIAAGMVLAVSRYENGCEP